jgi:hypothetical protein
MLICRLFIRRSWQLRAPFIAELEHRHCTEKGLMERLDIYLKQEVADYVLGIVVYDRSDGSSQAQQLLSTGTTKRPFAAIALLWRRGAAGPGGLATLGGVWSFGTCELSLKNKLAFCSRQHGKLQQVKLVQIVHPPVHTVETDTITIPKAELLQNVVDVNGAQVLIRDTDQNLTINLRLLRSMFDDTLPL